MTMTALWSKEYYRIWLAVVGCATILFITSYTLVQQATRLGANDRPMAEAQAAKRQLEKGTLATDVVSDDKIDIAQDTATFVTITDSSEHVLASSGLLGGQATLPPAGTFIYTKQHGLDNFTWQPKAGVRIAAYMLRYGKSPNDGFIIAGQSLKPAEQRITTYSWLSLAGWLATLAWASFTLLLPRAYKRS